MSEGGKVRDASVLPLFLSSDGRGHMGWVSFQLRVWAGGQ